jgi:4'-phosphopantetheinyl transferase
VDVETIKPGVDAHGVGRIVLTSDEQRELTATSEDKRPAAFARYWTRKEAILKATGDGLRMSASELEVSGPSCAPAVRFWRPRPWIADRIHVRDIDPDGGHRASVATIGERLRRVAHHDADGILPAGAVSTKNDSDGRSG